MKGRFSFVVLAVILSVISTGCASVNGKPHFFIQRGIVLTVVHLCTDEAMVYQTGKHPVDVKGPVPVDIAMEPSVWGDRNIQVTLQSLDPTTHTLHTYAASFPIDYQRTTAWQWIVGPAQVGGSRIRYSHCS
jgi:hypothetical protein